MVGLSESKRNARRAVRRPEKARRLARAIALNPELILYDEPTTGLDRSRPDVINELIIKLRAASSTPPASPSPTTCKRLQDRQPHRHASRRQNHHRRLA
jgi:hypothetical protein